MEWIKEEETIAQSCSHTTLKALTIQEWLLEWPSVQTIPGKSLHMQLWIGILPPLLWYDRVDGNLRATFSTASIDGLPYEYGHPRFMCLYELWNSDRDNRRRIGIPSFIASIYRARNRRRRQITRMVGLLHGDIWEEVWHPPFILALQNWLSILPVCN